MLRRGARSNRAGANGSGEPLGVLAGERADDELGRDRREQDPVAVVADRPVQAGDRRRADRRRVVGRGRPQPGGQLVDHAAR